MAKCREETNIYGYETPWSIYGLSWSLHRRSCLRVAIGSFVEEYNNKIQVVELDAQENKLVKKAEYHHPYPATKVLWSTSKEIGTNSSELLATTADYLRIFNVNEAQGISLNVLLNNNRTRETSPLTSADWNDTDHNIIGTSSLDTTCTIWDLNNTKQPKAQIISHYAEVYDMAFGKGSDIFASVSGDGSLRTFDLRSLDSCTILYESPDLCPIFRLSWNKQDPNYIAALMSDSNTVVILDVRVQSLPVAELTGHQLNVNSISWSPHSSSHIVTAGEDQQALIWNLNSLPKVTDNATPLLAYVADEQINQVKWSSLETDWIAMAVEKKLQLVKV